MEERKHNKNKYWLWLITAILFLLQSLPAQSQTVLESIQETGVLKVAVREDAAPFGYVDSANQLQGYCLDFIALLEAKLTEQLPRNTLIVKLLKSTISNRFQLVQQGLIYLECGPNTIRDLSSSKVTFSRPFFVTQVKFLAAKEQANKFNLDNDFLDVRIGVIRNTSTEQLIRERYPSAKLVLFSGVTARNRGVQAVAQGKIAAMVSDSILLRAEAAKQKLSVDEYALVPEKPLSSDRYGMIIKGEDPQWREFVNSVISSEEFQQLFKQWFNSIESFPQELK